MIGWIAFGITAILLVCSLINLGAHLSEHSGLKTASSLVAVGLMSFVSYAIWSLLP